MPRQRPRQVGRLLAATSTTARCTTPNSPTWKGTILAWAATIRTRCKSRWRNAPRATRASARWRTCATCAWPGRWSTLTAMATRARGSISSSRVCRKRSTPPCRPMPRKSWGRASSTMRTPIPISLTRRASAMRAGRRASPRRRTTIRRRSRTRAPMLTAASTCWRCSMIQSRT